ncbi:uncharacterized protein simc1 isoform X2 [Plectropomus leopardus]|nr:uncharacterized protein simc1 isoform X2 [Plectropomus leopardus]
MDDVITLSSDSDKDDSDVEIIGCFSNIMTKDDPLPLTAVRVHVDDVSLTPLYIDLTEHKWTLPELKLHTRQNSPPLTLVALTETNVANETIQKTESLPPGDPQKEKESAAKHQTSSKQEFNLQTVALQPYCGDIKPKQRRLDSQTQHQIQTDKTQHHTAFVKLRRLPFLETHVAKGRTSNCFANSNSSCTQMPLNVSQLDKKSEAEECSGNLRTTATNGPDIDPSLVESPPKTSQSPQSPADSPCPDNRGAVTTSKEHNNGENERDDFCSSMLITSPKSPSSSQDKAQGSLQREVLRPKLEQLGLDKAESKLSDLSGHLTPHSPTAGLNSSERFDLDSLSHTSAISHNCTSKVDPMPTFERTQAENTSEWQSEEVKADEASNSSDFLRFSIPSEPALSVSGENMDDGSGAGTYRDDLLIDSPVSFLWQEGSDGDEVNKESRFDVDFRTASREDRQFVCPVTLKKIMSGPAQALLDVEDDGFGTPEVLCRQSLSLVYSTIDESYTEGTLQLLSDLLQPGYYPPRDITSHLLRGILLDPQCPYHLSVQAFNLLMRTQRHHMADKTTAPWDWELLTSVMTSQDQTKRRRCEVVRMFLDYVVQTLEDDFQAKRSVSAINHSIAKATLSCDQQFHRIRDVIKWLFSAIMKSTEHEESKDAARERDEQIRTVFIFQRMLCLALEVDCSPALNSAKLSQELFHMLISNIPLRAHRMLLLESLQSKLLR